MITMGNQQIAGVATTRPTRRKWWRYILGLMFLGALSVGCFVWWQVASADSALVKAIAATDEIDPQWRLADLMANRAWVPDDENSATTILAGHSLLDSTKRPAPFDYEVLGKPVDEAFEFPAHRLSDQQKDALKALLPEYERALAKYRKVVDMPRGKYVFTWTPMALSSQFTNPNIRDAATALRYDFLDRLEAGETALAGDHVKAIINVARSIGDEPFAVSILIRSAVRAIAVKCTERWLDQSEPDLAMLVELQRRVEEEEAAPLLAMLARGERAASFESLDTILAMMPPPANGLDAIIITVQSWGADIGFVRRQKAHLLTGMIRFGDIVKLPSEQIPEAINQFDQGLGKTAMMMKLAVPAMRKVVESVQRSQAEMRCTATALAAERFRQQYGRWPEALDELVTAKLIAAVPLDPFDGKPLRWKAVDDGRLIYSVGPDRTDNGGVFNRADPRQPGSDIGLRLFDPARRRRPPRIAENKVKADGR
jgi:hypothetical protein